MIPPETTQLDLFNMFITNKKYPCIQYKNNFKFVSDFQIGEVIETDGLAIYSEHPTHTAKTIERYDRITIDPESKFTDQEYTNMFRMDFNAEVKENEQEEAQKLLQKLTGLENIPTFPEIQEDEYELSVQQLLRVGESNVEKGGDVPLDTPLHIISIRYSDIFATFYIPIEEISIEFYILQDLILNDDDFSIMAVDERLRAGRERDTLYLYMKNGNVRCNLSLGNTETEATVRKELTKIGSRSKTYLRVRVTRITELEDLERLRIVIERMLGLYLQKYKEVQDDYANYMVIEPITHKKGRGRKTRLAGVKMKEADPVAQELFGEETYYSSVCARPQQPDILELPQGYYKEGDKQKNKYEIIFPIPPYEDKQYLFDCSKGKKQLDEGEEEWKGERKVLISNPKRDKAKLYAGLKKNTSAKAKLESSQRHPYVPCCFNKPLGLRTNPANIRDITREYFQGKYGFGSPPKEEKVEIRKQPRLQTMKILKEEQAGDAPSSVTDLIYKIDVERKGFDGTLFGCVKNALYLEDEEDDVIAQIEDEIDQVSYLGDKYEVNIWIFSNQEAFKMGGRARIGKLVDTKQGVSFNLYDRNIVIFHNYGGAFQKSRDSGISDKGKYELIQSRKGKNKIRVFDNETVSPLIYVFNGLYPYKIIKKLQNVTAQYGSILEIDGGIYVTPEKIPRYAVKTLEVKRRVGPLFAQGALALPEIALPQKEEITYYGAQDKDFYNQYTTKQRMIHTILEYAKYSFSNFLKDMFQLVPKDSYQETMVKLEEFHKDEEKFFSLFQNEKCEEEKQLPDFDYTSITSITSMSFVDNHPLYSNGKFIYSGNEFLARVMFYIRQQLFIDEISLVTYYKRKTFGVGIDLNPYIKSPSSGERLIRSYFAMKLLTRTGGNDSIGIRDLKYAEDIQTQFVFFRGKTYSLSRADNVDDALAFSERVGLKISSYDLLSYNENGELEENIEGEVQAEEDGQKPLASSGSESDTFVFIKFDKFFSMLPYLPGITQMENKKHVS